jgi:hypothetical protein
MDSYLPSGWLKFTGKAMALVVNASQHSFRTSNPSILFNDLHHGANFVQAFVEAMPSLNAVGGDSDQFHIDHTHGSTAY